MRLYYQGIDITGSVDIVRCTHRDVSGGRCDSLEIELENAEDWFRWKPERGDVLEAAMDSYSTGKMYLNTILPYEGRYRILATSMPAAMRQKKSQLYYDTRLRDIMAICAAECGLDYASFGVDTEVRYPCIVRYAEGATAFLSGILKREGAVLKTWNGRLTAIGIEYAQNLEDAINIEIRADQPGMHYERRDDIKLGSISVQTPYANGSGYDTGVPYGPEKVIPDLPADSDVQAARWARSLLLMHNRTGEKLDIESQFAPGWTAMTRANISGGTDADGEWLFDEVTHDFMQEKSTAKLLRCIRTIR